MAQVRTLSGGIQITTANGTSTVYSLTSSVPSSIVLSLPPVPTIEVILEEQFATAPRTGATLSGTLPPSQRSIEAAGITGSVYEDGTFEIRNVPPGRHVVLTRHNPPGTRPFGASIVAGEQDIPNLQLRQILEVPLQLDAGGAATPAGVPGAVAPPVAIRGQLVDETTGAPFDAGRAIGRITVNGNTVSYTVNNTGEFEIQNLLPGRYRLDLWLSEHTSRTQTIEVGEKDMTLQWPVTLPD
jgi:hypothetical protein